jgi:hypothetical protein
MELTVIALKHIVEKKKKEKHHKQVYPNRFIIMNNHTLSLEIK